MDMRRTWNNRALTKALRKWRGERTYDQVGALLGVTGVNYYRYECGLRRVPPEKTRAYAEITGIEPEVLRPDIFGPPSPIKRQDVSAG